ncbi:uncharacterized protein [Palaemon carinicauda]|uniref:uncharacterized protein n=1 Tax=Palaemon carinicauda TaxID=392227 RepID=UPI0035B5FB0B
MYGAETWAIKNTEEKKLNVAEITRLRWMCGVTRRDKIRNEVIIGTTGVKKLSDKIQECRLRRYGHVIKRDEPYIGVRVLEIEVKGTRRGGRPKQSGIDLRSKGLIGDEVLDRDPKYDGVQGLTASTNTSASTGKWSEPIIPYNTLIFFI